MVRCSNCSRSFDGVGPLEGHDCGGENVTVVVVKPSVANEAGVNPARAYESRQEAEEAAEATDAPTRMIDAALFRERDA